MESCPFTCWSLSTEVQAVGLVLGDEEPASLFTGIYLFTWNPCRADNHTAGTRFNLQDTWATEVYVVTFLCALS